MRLPGIEINWELLRQTRLRAGLTLAQVAGTDISRQAVHQIETGVTRPTWWSLSLIAARLRLPLWQLLQPPGSNPDPDDHRTAALETLCHEGRWIEVIDEARTLLELPEPRLRAYGHLFMGRALLAREQVQAALQHLGEARQLFRKLPKDPRATEAEGWERYAASLHEERRSRW
jgi:transcriptional regulator with XRE-family HTH domain